MVNDSFFTFKCFEKDSESLKQQSLILLSESYVGVWVSIVIGSFGVLNNTVLLYIFYRLDWFREKHMILFWNLAIADLVSCLSIVYTFAVPISKKLQELNDIQPQLTCVAKFTPLNIAAVSAHRFDLAIALDRLIAKVVPFKWIQLGRNFRWILVIICWTWGVGQQVVYLITTPTDECILGCVSFLNYPDNTFGTFVGYINIAANIFLVTSYVIIPLAAALHLRSCVSKASQTNYIFNLEKMKCYHKAYLARVRLMSGAIVLVCFFCNGSLIADILGYLDPKSTEYIVVMSSISDVTATLNTFLPLYIWLIDASFRQKLLSACCELVHFIRRDNVHVEQQQPIRF